MILVSGCLIGNPCKYNGGHNRNEAVLTFLEGKEYLAVCPETAGGLTAPRPPAEREGNRVINSCGEDVTKEFYKGAELTLQKALALNPGLIILKANSPSCGVGTIYDGSFTKTKTDGNGVAAQMLLDAGFRVVTEKEIEQWEEN